MGLDVMALRGATWIDPQPDPDYADEHYETHHRAWVNNDFPDRADDRQSGFYFAQEALYFRAGSYGGYNRFRKVLSQAALGVDPEVIWAEPGEFEGRPFVELIHFADNEGILGPQVSAKLARDFAEHEAEIIPKLDEYDAGTYANFRKAFEMAAEDGLVQYH